MAQETERKFLLANEDWKTPELEGRLYKQGYLISSPEKAVRVRVAGTHGFITIKSGSYPGGFGRDEFEYEIPVDDAIKIFETLCEPGTIEKTRYEIPYEGHVWEVDVFHGTNDGLITAEIELKSENEAFSSPSWLGEEVTHDKRYTNGILVRNPYTTWE